MKTRGKTTQLPAVEQKAMAWSGAHVPIYYLVHEVNRGVELAFPH